MFFHDVHGFVYGGSWFVLWLLFVFFEKAIGMVAQQTIDRDTRRKSAESPDLKEVREDEPAMPIAPLPRGGYTTIAYVALGMLTIQNCGAVLLMRYTR